MYSKTPKQEYLTQMSFKGVHCILVSCTTELPPYIVWVL